jgi:transcriptional regulator with XRE-family HTH domain
VPSEGVSIIPCTAMERPAEAIERLRLERGLTQAQAGRRGEVAQATWSAVESGVTSRPHPDTKRRIARALCVTPSTIWRPRPKPLHLDDVEDPRWESAVRRMARRLDRDGSPQERQSFGRRLIAVLDYADPGSSDPAREEDRWEEFWRLANALLFDAPKAPITIIDGRLVERELATFVPDAQVRVVAARRERMRADAGLAQRRLRSGRDAPATP